MVQTPGTLTFMIGSSPKLFAAVRPLDRSDGQERKHLPLRRRWCWTSHQANQQLSERGLDDRHERGIQHGQTVRSRSKNPGQRHQCLNRPLLQQLGAKPSQRCDADVSGRERL